ncbi:putative UPF0481 protein At3g02645 [Telopea speciosissima]|uniref:putative UPF0481 protein At3g02645 n=1 Tax=Telopea speciosissima TaxID=54955 RepID=UPI001CC49237|nr:putative UPF0481 protein At3g02645 [Telopea speciosissima]
MYSSTQTAATRSSSNKSRENSSFDELGWVSNIRRTLDEELEEDTAGVPAVCIFNVPKTLLANKPECYIPQEVAIGPYHPWRSELYEMERYKVSAAKRTQKQFIQTLKFHNLVDRLMKHETRIRACFHKYLPVNGETLAWMMAVDACFLLEFLQVYAIKQQGNYNVLSRTIFSSSSSSSSPSSSMSHLVDHAGRKSAHNAILRDIMMLENQIPLFILRKILEVQYSSLDEADALLHSMLMGLCKDLSPLKMMMEEDFPNIQFTDSAHLLDCLYQIFLPKSEEGRLEITTEVHEDQNPFPIDENKEEKFVEEDSSTDVKKLLNATWSLLSKLNKAPVSFIKRVLLSRPVKLLFKLPWTIITRLPGFSILKQPVEYLFFNENKDEIKPENGSLNSMDNNKPPLLEEITIPSVSELYNSGIRFVATKGDITSISFDSKSFTFKLPSVSLDVNTEVVLRNLVAYEASNASGPLFFTRYVKLMNGIIDTEEDVKLLREKGIVLNHLKSDKEVADLWNGMSKSVTLNKVPFLDKVIEDINNCHSCRLKVKAKKFFKSYVIGSWQFLTFLAAILFLLLTTLQAFCSVYSCARVFHLNTNTTTG